MDMGGAQGGEQEVPHVPATYRQIAAQWGLKGPDQGRMKAKRAGWELIPSNHPGETVQVRVPLEAWDQAIPLSGRGTEPPPITHRAPAQWPLKADLEREREGRLTAEKEAGALRVELARREGELSGLKEALRMVEEGAKDGRERAAQADQRAQAAAIRAAELEHRALTAEREAADGRTALARIQGRGWLHRLLNVGA